MRDTDVIEHIKELCAERKWSYYRLAKESGLPYSTINNMLHRTNIPTVPTLQKMCDAFEITLSDFFLEGIKEYTLTNSQTELLEIYKNLSKDDRRMLIAYAKGLAKLLDAPKK
ncbi:helix-turn-helix transcriptional regulator [Blautia liquoris]|uniref:Helix-turn-helix transcriptional regulator n=1 Tax=Blautia liquoris TaxID=2779518 RepID=A0A7M2RFS6_9FIRM|nr:helix-turn-helix transcriptional regulator [Blautia liquoris]QOV19109.1 helix-turn-helix transcriptional regulator [Blautia liquoris]